MLADSSRARDGSGGGVRSLIVVLVNSRGPGASRGRSSSTFLARCGPRPSRPWSDPAHPVDPEHPNTPSSEGPARRPVESGIYDKGVRMQRMPRMRRIAPRGGRVPLPDERILCNGPRDANASRLRPSTKTMRFRARSSEPSMPLEQIREHRRPSVFNPR